MRPVSAEHWVSTIRLHNGIRISWRLVDIRKHGAARSRLLRHAYHRGIVGRVTHFHFLCIFSAVEFCKIRLTAGTKSPIENTGGRL